MRELIKKDDNGELIQGLWHFMYVVLYREKCEVVILESCYKNKKLSSKLKICLQMLIDKLQWGIKENISLKDVNAPPKAREKRWLPWFIVMKK